MCGRRQFGHGRHGCGDGRSGTAFGAIFFFEELGDGGSEEGSQSAVCLSVLLALACSFSRSRSPRTTNRTHRRALHPTLLHIQRQEQERADDTEREQERKRHRLVPGIVRDRARHERTDERGGLADDGKKREKEEFVAVWDDWCVCLFVCWRGVFVDKVKKGTVSEHTPEKGLIFVLGLELELKIGAKERSTTASRTYPR